MPRTVLHLIGADADLPTIDCLTATADAVRATATTHIFAQVAVPDAHHAARDRLLDLQRAGTLTRRLRPPFGCGALASVPLDELLDEIRPDIVHTWSPAALSACYTTPGAVVWEYLRAAARRRRPDGNPHHQAALLVDASCAATRRGAALIARGNRRSTLAAPRFVVHASTDIARLAGLGVCAAECVSFPAVPPRPIVAAAPAIRAALDVTADQKIVLILPPITRACGAFFAAWATLVLEKMRPELRLVIPGRGPEVERLLRLVDAIEHDALVRFPGDELSLGQLLTVADAAVLLAPHPVAPTGIAAALAAGVPLITGAHAADPGILRDGENAWLCPPADPKRAARRLLEALEDPAEARRRTEHARRDSAALLRSNSTPSEWRDLYE